MASPYPSESAWAEFTQAPPRPFAALDAERMPSGPGVFVCYRRGNAAYVGKCASLRGSVAGAVAARGPASVSALRRSVAEFLGIASATAIAGGRYRPTVEDHARISRWIRECEFAWKACASESEAVELEKRLLLERQSGAAFTNGT